MLLLLCCAMIPQCQNQITVLAILTFTNWFCFSGSQSETENYNVLLLDLKSAVSGEDYTPPRNDVYINENVHSKPNDKVARVAFGNKETTKMLDQTELCAFLQTNMIQQVNGFFQRIQQNSIQFSDFRMIACRLEDLPQINIPDYKSYTAVLGFTQLSIPTISNRNVQQTDKKNATIQWDRVYVDSKYESKKILLLEFLDNTFGRAKVTDSSKTLIKFGSLFHIKATLNVTWNDEFYQQQSKDWNFTGERFCFQVQQALRTNNGSQNVEILCYVNNYLPIKISDKTYVRISEQFSTIGSTFASTNSARMTDIINKGLQKLGTKGTFEIIGNVQVVRDSQFLTCATDGNICSIHAHCIQSNEGIQCVCAHLFTDANEALPGTDCRYSPGAIALIILPPVLFVGSAIVIIGLSVNKRWKNFK